MSRSTFSVQRVLFIVHRSIFFQCVVHYAIFNMDPVFVYWWWRRQNIRKRSMWAWPIYLTREKESQFVLLFPKLLKDPEKFFNFTRMSVDSFKELVRVGWVIQKYPFFYCTGYYHFNINVIFITRFVIRHLMPRHLEKQECVVVK